MPPFYQITKHINMKTTLTKSMIILLFATTGSGFSLFAQCVEEEDVYSFEFEGHFYEVIRSEKTWADAASCAVERGGILAEINSQSEQDTIYHSIIHGAAVPDDYTIVPDGGGIAYVWIGASDQQDEGAWLWDGDGDNTGTNFWNGQGNAGVGGGTPVDELYNNWGGSSSGSPNEPDNFNDIQDGGAIGLAKWPAGAGFTLGVASEWNDISSSNSLYFVVEYECMETRDTIDESACDLYTSPSGKTWTESGTYTDTIGNSAGCDSVITINLEVITVDTTVTNDGSTLTATATGGAYQWLDCESGHAVIEGETGQSFTPSANGNYAVEITLSGCKDTSDCYAMNPVVGYETDLMDPVVVRKGTGGEEFHVDLGGIYREITVQVTDIHGRIVHSSTMTLAQTFQFTLDEAPGIYIMTVRSGGSQAVIKLYKN